jgi:hypothetical protein
LNYVIILGHNKNNKIAPMVANQNFHVVKEAILTSEEGNFTLGETAKAKVYRVLTNDAGQILLDPIDLEKIPENQRWLWQNPEALGMVLRGIEQAARGEVHDLGSFAQYADLEIDD